MKLSSLTKKISLIFLSSVLFLNSMVMPFAVARAADEAPSTWYNQNPFQWYDKVHDSENPSEIFGERYTAAQVQWILFSLITVPFSTLETFNRDGPCLFGAIGDLAKLPLCANSYIQSVIDFLQELGIAQSNQTSSIGFSRVFESENRELSFFNYISRTFSKFSLIKIAYAQQGFGYGAVGMVQDLWTASRNAAYSIIVLITIIFAFMIMFRVKLSPQLVISVQSAMPKIFVALILATFSFAIAGLMIDLMYVFMGFVAAILAAFDGGGGMSFGFAYGFISGEWLGVHVSSFLVVFLYMLLYTVIFTLSIIVSIGAALSSLSVFGTILAILMILLIVWLLILCFVYTIRVPWMLIKALASIYLSVIVAPLQITLGAIAPQIGFGQWLRNLIANLLVFPVTGILFFFAYLILFKSIIVGIETGIERNIVMELLRMFGLDIDGILPGSLWSPPLLGTGAEISGLILAIMSFIVIVAIPKVTEIMKAVVLGAKFDFGSAIGEAMGPINMARSPAESYFKTKFAEQGRFGAGIDAAAADKSSTGYLLYRGLKNRFKQTAKEAQPDY